MTKEPVTPPAENQFDIQTQRHALVKKIMGKETFIDPLDAERTIKAYSVYDRNPQKINDVLIESFKLYCRKCIKESALLDVKNESSQMPIQEAEALQSNVTEELFSKIKEDQSLEQLLVMLIFKNHFWEGVRFNLKEIFAAQRAEPGHEINSYLNTRFHKLKKEKQITAVRDLVNLDVTEIVNTFKGHVMENKVELFT